jgi:hypothetical protein
MLTRCPNWRGLQIPHRELPTVGNQQALIAVSGIC